MIVFQVGTVSSEFWAWRFAHFRKCIFRSKIGKDLEEGKRARYSVFERGGDAMKFSVKILIGMGRFSIDQMTKSTFG